MRKRMIVQEDKACGYFVFNEGLLLVNQLESKNYFKIAFIACLGIYTGLRIGDILRLHWKDLLDQNVLRLAEEKTGKVREITLHPNLQLMIARMFKLMKVIDVEQLIFLNRYKKKVISLQYINRKLQQVASANNIKVSGNLSSHSLRKTFGRRVYEQNGKTDEALILLSMIFNHSSTAVTRRYLGIKKEEIANVYISL